MAFAMLSSYDWNYSGSDCKDNAWACQVLPGQAAVRTLAVIPATVAATMAGQAQTTAFASWAPTVMTAAAVPILSLSHQ